MTHGIDDFIEDCRQILIMARQKAALTSYEMARVVQMIPIAYIRAERDGKGLNISHVMKAAELVGLKLTLKFYPFGSPEDSTDIRLT